MLTSLGFSETTNQLTIHVFFGSSLANFFPVIEHLKDTMYLNCSEGFNMYM